MHAQSFFTVALAAFAAATPLERRKTGSTSNEFTSGGCRPVLFAWARGSTEIGNMGTVVGPPTSDGLKAALGDANVATQGLEYPATLGDNALPGGTSPSAKNAMAALLKSMASKCPDSVILAGGYSQGAAVVHGAFESLDDAVKGQIAGVVLYGDTQKLQSGGQIRDFDPAKTKIICAPGDAVCQGTLVVLAPHLSYGDDADEGAQFLVQQAQAAMQTNQTKRAEMEAKREVVSLANKAVKVAVKMAA